MDESKKQFIINSTASAKMVAHPFPVMTACEAALESGFGTSDLAVRYHNLFGMKQHRHPVFDTVSLPTHEFMDGMWEEVTGEFIAYPTIDDCFADRLATLYRLASVYPNYKLALEAQTPEDYIDHVSATWSTDPHRAQKVLAIYSEVLADEITA